MCLRFFHTYTCLRIFHTSWPLAGRVLVISEPNDNSVKKAEKNVGVTSRRCGLVLAPVLRSCEEFQFHGASPTAVECAYVFSPVSPAILDGFRVRFDNRAILILQIKK